MLGNDIRNAILSFYPPGNQTCLHWYVHMYETGHSIFLCKSFYILFQNVIPFQKTLYPSKKTRRLFKINNMFSKPSVAVYAFINVTANPSLFIRHRINDMDVIIQGSRSRMKL